MKLEWTQQNENCWLASCGADGHYWIIRHKDVDFEHYTAEYDHMELEVPTRLGDATDTLEAAQALAAEHANDGV